MAERERREYLSPPLVARSAIKFLGEHKARGVDILLDIGPAQGFPGWVYVCEKEQIEQSVPRLQDDHVEFLTRHDLSKGKGLTREECSLLAEREGWV